MPYGSGVLGRDSSNTALNPPRKRDGVSHTQHLYRWIFRHVPHTRVDQARPRDTAGQQPRKCRINKRRASSKHEYKCWGQLSIATPGSARRAASRRACRGLGSPMPTKPALTHPHRDAAGSNGASMKSFVLKGRAPKFLEDSRVTHQRQLLISAPPWRQSRYSTGHVTPPYAIPRKLQRHSSSACEHLPAPAIFPQGVRELRAPPPLQKRPSI